METTPEPEVITGPSVGVDATWTEWLATGVGLAVVVAAYLVMLIAYVRIIQKAGYSGWWVLAGVVPVLNVVMFLVFAFSTWPVVRENAELRARAGLPPR